MSDNPELDSGPAVWAVTDAVFAGRAVSWETAAGTTPPAEQLVLQELRRIADVIAAHDEQQQALDRASDDETWGPLVILEKIGAGAFGDVYRAREPRLDRQVALKFFHPHRLSQSQLTSDVIEEGRLLARVRHPNVVTVHGAKHLDGRFGIWMEFIEGTTLEAIVAEQGPLGADEAMAIGRDLCGALTALHDAGILHRDIKARNVMQEKGGRVVLMDLGISCEIDGAIPIRQYGTPLYAAPEVLEANEASRQGDIYSLGVLLYYLVSGRHPVTGPTLSGIQAAHAAGQVESLATVRPGLPAKFLRIVDKALAANRDERYATAAELEQALEDALNESTRAPHDTARASSGTDDRLAYNCYQHGRRMFNERYCGGLPKAIDCFRQAIACDPEFAMAHVGLADCFSILGYLNYLRPREAFAKAQALADRALEIDPDLGEVHATLGHISWLFDWDIAASEEHFRRAIRICPQYPFTRQRYALMLASRGRDDEALAEVEASRDLDPSSLALGTEAVVLTWADRFQEAIPLFRLSLESNPESWYYNTELGAVLWFAGEADASEALLRKAIQLSAGQEAFPIGMLAHVLIYSHREDEVHELIEHLDALARKRPVSYYHRMTPWLGLGRYDKWAPVLEKAIEERDSFLACIRPGAVYSDWLADPRFSGPLRQAGLVE